MPLGILEPHEFLEGLQLGFFPEKSGAEGAFRIQRDAAGVFLFLVMFLRTGHMERIQGEQ